MNFVKDSKRYEVLQNFPVHFKLVKNYHFKVGLQMGQEIRKSEMSPHVIKLWSLTRVR